MNTSPPNKNFLSKTACLSLDMLKRYAVKKLSAPEKHEVENHLLDCELCATALEGYLLLPVTDADISEINKKIAPEESLLKNILKSDRFFIWAVGSAAMFILSYFAYDQMKSEFAAEKPAKQFVMPEVETPTVKAETTFIVVENPEIVKLLANETPPEKFSGKESKEKNTFAQKQKEAMKFDLPDKTPSSVTTANGETGVLENAALQNDDIFIENLKITAYEEYYTASDKYAPPSSPLVEPRFANKNEKALAEQNDLKRKENTFSADNILRKALQNFNAGNYKACVSLMDILLKQNPADVNALFYSAISLENLNGPELALNYLEKVLQSDNNSFREEARWHKALLFLRVGNNTKATALLKEIADEDGFYTEQAKEKLK